jgi:pimeloyl-ACP methyl ester carboxylesterase
MRIATRWTSIVRSAIRSACGSPCPAATTDLARRWIAPLRQRAGEHAVRELLINADYGLTPQAIASIVVPTSIIWGREDHQGGSLAATVASLHHPPERLIDNAGHLTMLADPAAFAAAVEFSASRDRHLR